ncbi:hypothetical protein GIX45_13610 [Erwinia sp. CPCC 100877]|nr:hypothetical protein [Erwinia sp. CPCC 100877]
MKSEDTLKWFPAQVPAVRKILGDAILAVAKQGRPINARTLCDFIQSNQRKLRRIDSKTPMDTAILLLKDSQNKHGNK